MPFRRGKLGKLLEESFSVRRPLGNYEVQVSVDAANAPVAFQAIIRLRGDADTVETNFAMQSDRYYVSLTPILADIRLENQASTFQTQDQVVRWSHMQKAGETPTREEVINTLSGVLTIMHIEELPRLGRQMLYCEDTTQRVG